MVEEKVIIRNEEGLHARPATRYLQKAVKFKSDIILVKDGREYDGKSILSILSMGAHKGVEITIRCEGEDEQKAVESLKYLIENEL